MKLWFIKLFKVIWACSFLWFGFLTIHAYFNKNPVGIIIAGIMALICFCLEDVYDTKLEIEDLKDKIEFIKLEVQDQNEKS